MTTNDQLVEECLGYDEWTTAGAALNQKMGLTCYAKLRGHSASDASRKTVATLVQTNAFQTIV